MNNVDKLNTVFYMVKEAMMRREALAALLSAPSLLTSGGAKTVAKNVGKAHFSAMASAPIKKVTGVDMVPIYFKTKSNHTLLDRLKNNAPVDRRKFVKSTVTDASLAHTPAGMAINKIAPMAPGLAMNMLRALGNAVM